ncbi:MAG: class I SAM-dependent methyltransferase [Pseudonocardiaceae bacterium]
MRPDAPDRYLVRHNRSLVVVAHSHDGMDWAGSVERLRRADGLAADALRQVAARLVRPDTRVVIDVGSGAGGMGAAFAEALPAGGTVVLVDTAPELLHTATAHVRTVSGERVEVRAVQADADADTLLDLVPRADLVFASFVVHHLPDQQRGVERLSALVRPRGRLALVESGLEQRCLPWDIGLGEPDLQGRLLAAHGKWFRQMRATMEGAVRLPVGWNRALTDAGLVDVSSFSYLVDRPAPPTDEVRTAVLHWLAGIRDVAQPWISEPDLRVVGELLDEDAPHYVGRRDDLFLLTAHTVHVGTAPD